MASLCMGAWSRVKGSVRVLQQDSKRLLFHVIDPQTHLIEIIPKITKKAHGNYFIHKRIPQNTQKCPYIKNLESK